MILLDVNVLLAAHREDHPQHAEVTGWFTDLTSGDESFWVPDVVWASFVRISTNRRIFPVPTPVDDAFAFLKAVRGQPNHVNLEPSERHLALFETLCRDDDAAGDLAADAYLAALALDRGCEVVSFDRDFARFSGLRWSRPAEVTTFQNERDRQVYEAVAALLRNHPEGATVKQVAEAAGLRERVVENNLWRLCPSTPGDRQAGGGMYSPPKLVRLTDSRPYRFTLYQGPSRRRS